MQNALVNGQLIKGARVTISLEEQASSQSHDKHYHGKITSPLGTLMKNIDCKTPRDLISRVFNERALVTLQSQVRI